MITFDNGDQTQVLSDLTWTGREGSIEYDTVYNGEIYDSRRDRPNWAQVGFNDTRSAWIMPDSLRSPVNSTAMDSLHFEVTSDDSLES
jgi:hypothetical protein